MAIDPADLLPPGVHPLDPRSGQDPSGHPVPHDQPGARYATSRRAWGVPNAQALGVFQRLGSDASVGVVTIDANQGGTSKVVGRQPGRTRLTLWVPTSYFPGGVLTTAVGVLVSGDEGEIQQQWGVPMFPGDSMSWDSESGVWAGLQPGQTTGVVAFIHAYNPAVTAGGD